MSLSKKIISYTMYFSLLLSFIPYFYAGYEALFGYTNVWMFSVVTVYGLDALLLMFISCIFPIPIFPILIIIQGSFISWVLILDKKRMDIWQKVVLIIEVVLLVIFLVFACVFHYFVSPVEKSENSKEFMKKGLYYYVENTDYIGSKIQLMRGVSPNCDTENNPADEYYEDVFIKLVRAEVGYELPSVRKNKLLDLMLQHGADVNKVYRYEDYDFYDGNEKPYMVPSSEYTPLMIAVARSDYDTVQLLVEHGANMNFVTKDGCSAYIIASSKVQHVAAKQVLDYLVENGVDTSVTYQDYLDANFEKVDELYYSKAELDALETLSKENDNFKFDRSDPYKYPGVEFENCYNNEMYVVYLVLDSESEVIDLTSFKVLNDYVLRGSAKELRVPVDGRVYQMGFVQLEGLEKITLPSNITFIESGTFTNCPNLTEIKIMGKNVTIDSEAFYDLINDEGIVHMVTIHCQKDAEISNPYYDDESEVRFFEDSVDVHYGKVLK